MRLFAGYRDRVGKAEICIELPDGSTVGFLAKELLRRYPGLTLDSDKLVVAVNQEYRDHLYALSDTDEIALIPPVSGGCND